MGFVVGQFRIPFQDFNRLNDFAKDYPCISEIIDFLEEWYDPQRKSIDFMSSGSTGLPKVISHTKQAMRKSASITASYFSYSKGDHALCCLPVRFVAGRMMIARAIVSELELHIVEPSAQPLALLQHPVDFVAMTPFQLSQSLSSDPDKLSMLKTILLGGAPVSGQLLTEIKNIGPTVYLGYGMTETLTHVAIRRLNGKRVEEYFRSVAPSVRFDVDDRSCLIVDAAHLESRVITNDIVQLMDHERFEWLGRWDNVINSGGLKVYPEALEKKCVKELGKNCLVFGVEDSALGQRIAILIESEFKMGLVQKLKDVFSTAERNTRPRKAYFTEKFKYTETGKVKRQATIDAVNMSDFVQL